MDGVRALQAGRVCVWVSTLIRRLDLTGPGKEGKWTGRDMKEVMLKPTTLNTNTQAQQAKQAGK